MGLAGGRATDPATGSRGVDRGLSAAVAFESDASAARRPHPETSDHERTHAPVTGGPSKRRVGSVDRPDHTRPLHAQHGPENGVQRAGAWGWGIGGIAREGKPEGPGSEVREYRGSGRRCQGSESGPGGLGGLGPLGARAPDAGTLASSPCSIAQARSALGGRPKRRLNSRLNCDAEA